MQGRVVEQVSPISNVHIDIFENGKLIDTRDSHNVLTNTGRKWLRNLCRAVSFSSADSHEQGWLSAADVSTAERPRFIGLGVGGILTSDSSTFYGTQEELTTVYTVEDHIQITSSPTWLKEIEPSPDSNTEALPDDYTLRFIANILESEVSFFNNETRSGETVGPTVRVSEAGLYLSGATPTEDLSPTSNNATRCIAYNTFEPVPFNPKISIRLEWDFRW